MKNIKISFLLLCFIGTITSCKKSFLEQQPVGAFNESALNNARGVQQLLNGAYSALNGTIASGGALVVTPGQVIFGSIRGGEALKGSTLSDQSQWIEVQKYSVNPGNSSLQAFFQYYYDAVYRCNLVINTLPKVNDLTENQKQNALAEARFLRGHYHFMLKRLFKNVPFLDETSVGDVRISNVDNSGNYVNAWPKIKEDFDFARKQLPATQSDLGRANKWAAESYYGKVLVYMGCEGDASAFNEGLTVLTNVIINGVTSKGEKYALLANYHDNFSVDRENNSEFIFGAQCSANDGSTTALGPTITNVSANSNFDPIHIGTPNSAGPSTGFSFFAPTQWFVDHFRVDANGLPYLDNYATNPTSIKSDDGIEANQPFTIETNPVDPRLDWSVGRRGIQFLDYAEFGGKSWMRDQATAGPYLSKKYFTYKSEIGKYTTVGWPINALNIAIIRFDDVLLLTAELEARVGSLDKARDYVNQVRNRMVQNSSSPHNWVKKADGVTNAASYSIGLYPSGSPAFANKTSALKAILFERTLELGLEGHRAYDLVRFGLADNTADTEELTAFIAFESQKRQWLAGSVYTRTPDGFMPIPQTAIDNSQKEGKTTLKQNPGY